MAGRLASPGGIRLAQAQAAAQKQRIRILAISGRPDSVPKGAANEQAEPAKADRLAAAGVSLIPLERILTDKALFQNREADFSEESVQRILRAVRQGSFRMEVFDPVLLWKKPLTGELYVLSGHSRTEAFRRLAKADRAFARIPAKTISVPVAEARKIARESNTLATRETDLERAAYYRSLRLQGNSSDRDILEEARANEGRNAAYLLNLSHLNPDGELWQQMRALSEAGESQRTNLNIIGDWTGQARRVFAQLTNSHENEISRWLTTTGYGTKAGQFSSKQKFLERLGVSVNRNTQSPGGSNPGAFQSDKPLNIANSIATGDREAEYQQEYAELLAAVGEAEKLLKEKTAHAYSATALRAGEVTKGKTTQEIADQVVKQYAMAYSAAKQRLNALVGSREAFIKADRAQSTLFGLGRRKRGLGGFRVDEYYFDFIPAARPEVYGDWLPVREMIPVARQWLVANMKGKSVPNANTGYQIQVTDNAIGKWFSGKNGEIKLKAYTAIEDIIKVGVKVGQTNDKHGDSNVVRVHQFWSVVMVDGNIYPFGFLVDETRQGVFIYHTTLIPTAKTAKPDSGLAGFKSSTVSGILAGYTEYVEDIAKIGKKHSIKNTRKAMLAKAKAQAQAQRIRIPSLS